MKAWRLKDSDTAAGLVYENVAMPQAEPGEVVIRVQAAGVTPSELQWYPTTHLKNGEKRRGAVPGHEFAGTVAVLGTGADGVVVGQAIYGMSDWFADGAMADYCVTRPEMIAPRPEGLSIGEAAATPIGALTAWQGLFDRAKLQRGETVLIHGGSGAVGVFAVQLAKRHGAHVVTTAAARNKDFLLGLGAERVIDYHTERFEKLLKGVDVVFDGVGGETLERSWGVLALGGRLVTIAAESGATTDERIKQAFFIVEAKRQQLIEIGHLLETKAITAMVDSEVPLAQAGEAFAGEGKRAAGRGKVVVVMG